MAATGTARPLVPIAKQKMKPPLHVYEQFLYGQRAETGSIVSTGWSLVLKPKYGGMVLAQHGPDGIEFPTAEARAVVLSGLRIDAMTDWHAQGFRHVLSEFGATIADEERDV